jgi:hypothetical protein
LDANAAALAGSGLDVNLAAELPRSFPHISQAIATARW